MNQLPTFTTLSLAFFTLGTIGLVGTSIADSIARSSDVSYAGSSILLSAVSILFLLFGSAFILLQWHDGKTSSKPPKKKDEKDLS